MKTVIIGGGASGLIAAITAMGIQSNKVTILERQSRVGKKLSATGNGRCNLSNRNASAAHYHGDAGFAAQIIDKFPVEDTLQLFSRLGLVTVEEASGRVYPFSDQAGSVVDILRLACDDMGVRTETGVDVKEIRKLKKGFRIVGVLEGKEAFFDADNIIVACGGKAGSKLGGTDTGYQLLKSFGHTCTQLRPSLVQVKTNAGVERGLKGIRAVCGVKLQREGKIIAKSEGEVQFTDYGLSGPAVFDLTATTAVTEGDTVCLDLLPVYSYTEAVEEMLTRAGAFPNRTAENLLTGVLQNRLGRTIVKQCGIAFETKIGDIAQQNLKEIANTIKTFRFPVSGVMGYEQAQVTAGGIRTAEFDRETLESRLCPGIYACGEVLNVDGDCGGYNLQWAWSSGRLAGQLRGGLK